MAALLVLDQGSHATRATCIGAGGRPGGAATVEVASTRPAPDRCEHDAEELVASMREAIRGALGAGDPAGMVAGLATQRSTIACWDRDSGQALGPVISWQDRRQAAWLAHRGLDAAEVRRITGLVPSPHYGASKLRWCLDHLPRVREARDAGRLCMGPLSSFLLFRLLEERPFVVDAANASRTLLWDVNTGAWSPRMLEVFGVPPQCLPACVPGARRFGTLGTAGGGIPLAACTGDQAAALFVLGRPAADTVYVNLGTGAFVQRAVAAPGGAADGLLHSVAWEDEGGRVDVLEGTVNGAGAALEWLAGEQGTPLASLLARAPGWLDEVAAPPLFVNGVGGLGAPFWVPDCPVRFEGRGGAAERTVAVLESIVFLLKANLEALEAAAGPARRIVVSGGLSRLDGLCERLAGLAGVPVERPAETEATTAGLAFLLSGAVAAGDAPPRRFPPDQRPGQARRYRRWREVMAEAIRA